MATRQISAYFHRSFEVARWLRHTSRSASSATPSLILLPYLKQCAWMIRRPIYRSGPPASLAGRVVMTGGVHYTIRLQDSSMKEVAVIAARVTGRVHEFMARTLQLNFTPIQMQGEALQFQTLPFRDAQQLRDLRSRHRADYAFTRRGEQIIALPMRTGLNSIGESKTVSLAEHLPPEPSQVQTENRHHNLRLRASAACACVLRRHHGRNGVVAGRRGWIRTNDLHHVMVVLYQLSYTPVVVLFYLVIRPARKHEFNGGSAVSLHGRARGR